MEADVENNLVTRDGLRVAYYVDDFTEPWTKPETIVLLHAAMSSSKRWFRMVPQLASRYRVVRMDLRGHGASAIPSPQQQFSLQHLVDDVVELLDRLAIDRAHMVGSSAGGYVAQQLAAHYPSRVKSLALFASTPGLKNSRAPTWIPQIQKIGLKQFLADTIEDRFEAGTDPDLVRWFIEQAGSNDPAFIGRFVLHMCTHDLTNDLSKIKCPTLIVAAGAEALHAASVYEAMRNRIANSELIYYDTTGHNVCDAFPDACARDLLNFLGRLSNGARPGLETLPVL